jgi:hypothetical protein
MTGCDNLLEAMTRSYRTVVVRTASVLPSIGAVRLLYHSQRAIDSDYESSYLINGRGYDLNAAWGLDHWE